MRQSKNPIVENRRDFMHRTARTLVGLGLSPFLVQPVFAFGTQAGRLLSRSSPWLEAVPNSIEAYAPLGEGVLRTAKVEILFASSLIPHDGVTADSVSMLIGGQEEQVLPYYADFKANHRFRVVPFPFWPADQLITVEIPDGVRYNSGDLALEESAQWSFRTTPDPIDERYDPSTTSPLNAEELVLAHAGTADRFLDENVVTNYQDSLSSLYEMSVAIDPQDPEVSALGDKMITSLTNMGAIGLAAPQLGINRRMFVAQVAGRKNVYLNPMVESYSPDTYYGAPEGCLSIDLVRAKVGRPRWITVEYDTPEGQHVQGEYLSDDDAKVWLHEYDHVNGILMVDRQQERALTYAEGWDSL